MTEEKPEKPKQEGAAVVASIMERRKIAFKALAASGGLLTMVEIMKLLSHL